MGAMLMVQGPDNYITPLNPAVAFGTMFEQVYHGQADAFARIYIYIPFPVFGGLVAVLFHEFIYKKVTETIKESEEAEGFLDNQYEEDGDKQVEA